MKENHRGCCLKMFQIERHIQAAFCSIMMVVVIFGLSILNRSCAMTPVLESNTLLVKKTSGFGSIPILTLPLTTKTVVINLGANIDPIKPARRAGPCAKVLAFEPIVPDSIPPHPQVLVVPAAVSSKEGLLKMEKYNNGLSSSLSKPASNNAVFQNKEGRHVRLVPAFSLTNVIQAIPHHVKIDLVYTDIQGYDFDAISSAIQVLQDRRVEYIYSEVTVGNVRTYLGVENDFCRHWMPFMEANGYVFVEANRPAYNPRDVMEKQCAKELKSTKESVGVFEMDVLWRLADMDPKEYQGKTPQEQLEERTTGRLADTGFEPSDYGACDDLD